MADDNVWSDVPEVVRVHMDAVVCGDPAAMAADYAHDAVVERPEGSIVGREAIEEYFRGVPARLAGGRVMFESVDVHEDDHVTFHWRIVGGPADGSAGADTVVLRDGRIAHQRVQLHGPDF